MGALFNDLKEVLTQYAIGIKNRYTKSETNALLSNATEETSTALNAIREDLLRLDIVESDLAAACTELEVDSEGLVYLLNKDGERLAGPYGPFAGGGSGGGGSSSGNNAKIEMHNESAWLMKTIADGDDCYISFTWSSVEDEIPTGNGVLNVIVNGSIKAVIDIPQGLNEVDVSRYLSAGNNTVKMRVSDTYGNNKTINYTIRMVKVSISSTFDPTITYTGSIAFPYTPIGAVEKTIYFKVDDEEPETKVTSVSGSQLTYSIPSQSHGPHTFECWFECEVNGMTVESNHLYYEIMCTEIGNNDPIIASDFNTQSVMQYTTIQIPYSVYNPRSATSEITIKKDGTTLTTLTVDRNQQVYSIKMVDVGTNVISIECGNVSKTLTILVEAVDIDVEAVSENLELYLSSAGRSNGEANPATWTYDSVSAVFNGFNFTSDGWQRDPEGNVVLRVSDGASVTIPFNAFKENTRITGLTIEIEFAARNVADFDTVIFQSWDVNRGLLITPNEAIIQSEQTSLNVPFKENEHMTLAITVGKRNEGRLVKTYIDGIVANVSQYPDDDDWAQITQKPLKIGGIAGCTIDIYKIRVYSNDLSAKQIVENWISDTQDGSVMLDRYNRNLVFDEHIAIVPEKLPKTLPYMIISCPELPQYKGDKKTATVVYVDPLYSSKCFTATGCQINVQGTSSAPYAVKNLDMQFKGGFDMQNGVHESKYTIRQGAMPTNRFVIKADVASSESANNTQLVRLYNDICPYKFQEMREDSRVRWGIDGIQIVMFWRNEDDELIFKGKYNFNFPKRFPDGYGYSGDDESWEFQNNTSNRMLFKDNDFSRIYTDPETLETIPEWKNDFEARFPDDTWEDTTKLKEFMDWIITTDRSAATGNSLAESVTYDGTEYTVDSEAYRLAKFKAEFALRAQKETFIFYYIFTEFFLMVDSRAKNLFIGFHGDPCTIEGSSINRKLVAEPYDMDTAMGTNNEGTLTYGYSYEDIDNLDGANIFNGQNSVLWCNLRDAFRTDIVQMYQTLRSTGGLNYNNIESRIEAAQETWPENVWNVDAKIKYIDPLLNPETGKEPTAFYLPMAQGSKKAQRRWWLQNRFAYCDSKWNAGDALRNVIQLRGYAKSNVTITPYIDMYPTVKFGSYLVQTRGTEGHASELVCPMDNVNDTEIYIYSAPRIESAGDLSGLKVGVADFSAATNIKSVKVGSNEAGYSNPNMRSLSFGSNALLEVVDARNCVNLGSGDQKSIDLSNCSILKELYFEGTVIQGLSLPNGAPITKIHVPSTMTNITLKNLAKLADLVIGGYSNISTLWIENTPVDSYDILSRVPANTRVHLVGFTWEINDDADLTAIKTLLDSMRGLDEFGNNQDGAYVSGVIHANALMGASITSFEAVYPYVDVQADHVASYLTYKDTDGVTTLKTVTYLDGVPQDSGPSTNPTKASTAQYSYTFVGWNTTAGQETAESGAETNVIGDRTLYPAFSKTVRTYTVTWVSNGSTIETDNNVPYGTNPTYDGATPTGGANDGPFIEWTPTPEPITGNATYTATFTRVYTITWKNSNGVVLATDSVAENTVPVYSGATPVDPNGSCAFDSWDPTPVAATADAIYTATYFDPMLIQDSWETIVQKVNNGTADYTVGMYKPLDLGTEGVVNMQIVGSAADGTSSNLASGPGYAVYDWLSIELLNTCHRMNPELNNSDDEGTGAIGGWPKCELRTYLRETIKPLIPTVVRNAIKEVIKYSYCRMADLSQSTVDSFDDVWIPSRREIMGSGDENKGPSYNSLFNSDSARKKYRNTSISESWWTRSCKGGNLGQFYVINGGTNSHPSQTELTIAIGFSMGDPNEIRDDWSTIVQKINNGTADYTVGMYKPLDLGTEGVVNMQIVGSALSGTSSELANGHGNAMYDWLSVELLNTPHRINPQNNEPIEGTGTVGGWPKCELRTYLRETVKPLIPSTVRNAIKEVKKYSYGKPTSSGSAGIYENNIESVDDVWIPSFREIVGSTLETRGPIYSEIFTSQTYRKKNDNTLYNKIWWMRSGKSNNVARFCIVNADGYTGSDYSMPCDDEYQFPLGFSMGDDPNEIADDWSTIVQKVNNGTADYKVGMFKPLDLGTEGVVNMQIVGSAATGTSSPTADGLGVARYDWVSKELLKTGHVMNLSRVIGDSQPYNEGAGSIGGWPKCDLRTYLKETIKPLIPATVRNAIKEVTKYSKIIDTSGEVVINETSTDDVWIPSAHEVFGSPSGDNFETQGPVYTALFVDGNSLKKCKVNASTSTYWLRSTTGNSTLYKFLEIGGNGNGGSEDVNTGLGIALGFSMGFVGNNEIADDWSTIVQKINNGTADYTVGMYKPLDLGTEGVVNMQIIGSAANGTSSPLANGQGNATYDWLSKELLNTDHRMNPGIKGSSGNYTEGTGSIGGWLKCEMRTYLKETIKPLIPSTVRNAIKEVTKYSKIFDTSGNSVNNVVSTDDVWIPSVREVRGGSTCETNSLTYYGYINGSSKLKKHKPNGSTNLPWFSRSATSLDTFMGTDNSGSPILSSASSAVTGIPLGFSL